MNHQLDPQVQDLLQATHYRPSISILLNTASLTEAQIGQAVKVAADEALRKVEAEYPREVFRTMQRRIDKLITGTSFQPEKKSLGLFISPLFEKVIHLDVPLESRVVVDESFQIRDVVYDMLQHQSYLVLVLGATQSRFYYGTSTSLERLQSDLPDSINEVLHDIPNRMANYSDPAEKKEILLEKYLHQVDNALDGIMAKTKLPLILVGVDRVTGHFMKLTRHRVAITTTLQGNYIDATLPDLLHLLHPYREQWSVKQDELLRDKIDTAISQGKLVSGMHNVWRAVAEGNAALLIVEKQFMYPAQRGPEAQQLYEMGMLNNHFDDIYDAVDDTMERVLNAGGQVAMVGEDFLLDLDRIALIRYY